MRGLVIALLMLSACTEQQMARQWGGNARMDLVAGRKLITMTWKQDDLWVLTRPMREGETAETYVFGESSSFGLIEGSVKVVEHER